MLIGTIIKSTSLKGNILKLFGIKPVYATILVIGLLVLISGVWWYLESNKYSFSFPIHEIVNQTEYTEINNDVRLARLLAQWDVDIAQRENKQLSPEEYEKYGEIFRTPLYNVYTRIDRILPEMHYSLAKDEILKCKLKVISEEKEDYFIMRVTDNTRNSIVDSGKIKAGDSYNFSLKAKHTWSHFVVSFEAHAEYAWFYSNYSPSIANDVSSVTRLTGTATAP